MENFHRIENFDPERDRVFIFDCERRRWHQDHPFDSTEQSQLDVADSLTAQGLQWGVNLFFIHRRNWADNCGTQLDYFRSLLDGLIPMPEYCTFMQEHYLDLERFVNVDTIPEETAYDLDQVEAQFKSDLDVGCVILSRLGIRISTSNPDLSGRFVGGDGSEILPNAVRRHLFPDGGNFACRPRLYTDYFARHRSQLTAGNGSYGFGLVWEPRMGQILYDQGITWLDLHRDAKYRTIADVDDIEQSRGEKISMLWYDCRHYYFLYGRDQHAYPPTPLRPLLRYLIKRYLPEHLRFSRDTRLMFIQPEIAEQHSTIES